MYYARISGRKVLFRSISHTPLQIVLTVRYNNLVHCFGVLIELAYSVCAHRLTHQYYRWVITEKFVSNKRNTRILSFLKTTNTIYVFIFGAAIYYSIWNNQFSIKFSLMRKFIFQLTLFVPIISKTQDFICYIYFI